MVVKNITKAVSLPNIETVLKKFNKKDPYFKGLFMCYNYNIIKVPIYLFFILKMQNYV